MEENRTLSSILKAAKAEFLEKGFQNASLRRIVRQAGVTTGAFYGYFSSKEALFAAIVEPHAQAVMEIFMHAQISFAELPAETQICHMGVESGDGISRMVDYIYEHFDEFKLIICRSDGTAYESFVHNMVEIEVEYTYKFIDVLKRLGSEVPEIDDRLMHILISGTFSSLLEFVVHDLPKDKAEEYVKVIQDFNNAGWRQIMGFDFS